MIIAAAARTEKGVYTLPAPARHGDVLSHMFEETTREEADRSEQGFIDSNEGFVDRERAYEIARECGQIVATDTPGILFSEQMWTNGGEPPGLRPRENERFSLDPHMRPGLEIIKKVLGTGFDGSIRIGGENGLATHWKHRHPRDLTLWLSPNTWECIAMQPTVFNEIKAKLDEDETIHHAVVNERGVTARWGIHEVKAIPQTEPPAQERKWWWVEGHKGVRVADPCEALTRIWLEVIRGNNNLQWTQIYDIAWSRSNAPQVHRRTMAWLGIKGEKRAKEILAGRVNAKLFVWKTTGRKEIIEGSSKIWTLEEIAARALGQEKG